MTRPITFHLISPLELPVAFLYLCLPTLVLEGGSIEITHLQAEMNVKADAGFRCVHATSFEIAPGRDNNYAAIVVVMEKEVP